MKKKWKHFVVDESIWSEISFVFYVLMDANETHRVAQGCNLSWIVLTALKFYFPVLEKHHRILNKKKIQQHYVLMMVAMRINDKRNFHLLNIFQFKNFSIFFSRNSVFLQYFSRKCSVLLFVPVDVIHFVNNLSKNDSFLVQYWRPYHMTTVWTCSFLYMLTYICVLTSGWLNDSGFDWFSFLNPCQLLYILENFNFNFRHSQKWWLQIWQCPSCPVL